MREMERHRDESIHLVQSAQAQPAQPAQPYLSHHNRHNFFLSHRSKFTKTVNNKNNYPAWYETIIFETFLPENPAFFPQVNVQLWDHEELCANDYLSCIMAPLGEENIVQAEQPPSPEWFELFVEDIDEKGKYGKILCSFQLVDLTKEIPPIPKSISPEFHNVFIEVILICCNNLEAFESRQIEFANIEFCIGSGGENEKKEITKGSKKPSRSNPNFLERKIVECSLPIGEIFLEGTPLIANLYDNRSFGFGNRKPLVGACKINLKDVEVEAIKRNRADSMAAESGLYSPFKQERGTPVHAIKELEMHSPRIDIYNDDQVRTRQSRREDSITSHLKVSDAVGTENRFRLGRAKVKCTLEDYLDAPPFRDFSFVREGDLSNHSVGTMKARVMFLMNRVSGRASDIAATGHIFSGPISSFVSNSTTPRCDSPSFRTTLPPLTPPTLTPGPCLGSSRGDMSSGLIFFRAGTSSAAERTTSQAGRSNPSRTSRLV